jgi:hypothetical protein
MGAADFFGPLCDRVGQLGAPVQREVRPITFRQGFRWRKFLNGEEP